jgi:sugar lactone lactonase YvrE
VRRNSFLICLSFLVFVIAAMNGCVISPRRIVGGGSPTPTPSGSPTPGAAGKLYVTNQNGNSILRFDNGLTASGNVTPAATIFGAGTGLAGPQFITIDAAADRLFVANANGPNVLVFDGISTRTGNALPTRIITGPAGTFTAPSDVALDKTRDLLYVADGAELLVFSPASTVSGTTPVTRDITLTFGGAQINTQGIFLDAANDRLYVTDPAGNAIDVFDTVSTLPGGFARADRNISGTNTKLAQPGSVTLDGSGNLVVANQGNGSITVYASAATANANQTPIATIAGTNTTLLAPGQIIHNPANSSNEVYVADTTANEVAVFSGVSTANGPVAPVRQISGITSARGVALDTTR